MYSEIRSYIDDLDAEQHLIPETRKVLLQQLADYTGSKRDQSDPVLLNFICTHNSRRSQISQIWAATFAHLLQLDRVLCYSGGTEATEFNHRAVEAMVRAGFHISNPGGPNPHYRVSFSPDTEPMECFSKTYDDTFNPQSGFAAIMTCSDADENCPFIPGVDLRIPLTYEDPKEADDSPEEASRYDERVRQIGRELLYSMQLIS